MIKKLLIVACCFMLILGGLLVGFKPLALKADTIKPNNWYTFSNSLEIGEEDKLFIFNVNAMSKQVFSVDYDGQTYSSNTIKAVTMYNNTLHYVINIVEKEFGTIQSLDILVYDNGWVNDEYRYLYISSYEPNNDYPTFWADQGVWGYAYLSSPSDIKELMYTFVDIIPRTMQNLTSFEILGTTLFAIIGTAILVLFIVKITGKL